MEHSESRGWLLNRALEDTLLSSGETIEGKQHVGKQECWNAKNHSVKNNPILRHPEAICWNAFQHPDMEKALFCPT